MPSSCREHLFTHEGPLRHFCHGAWHRTCLEGLAPELAFDSFVTCSLHFCHGAWHRTCPSRTPAGKVMSALLGKSVLIGVTCVDLGGTELDRFQTYGTIEVDNEEWIAVRREGLSELFGLPPAPELLEAADQGVYTLHSTGEQIEDPDYVVSLKVKCLDPESLLTIRGVGFSPHQ